MKKCFLLSLAFILFIGCEAEINGEKIFDTHPNELRIENFCGLDMFFYRNYHADIREHIFDGAYVRNREDSTARLSVTGDDLTYYLNNKHLSRRTYPGDEAYYDVYIEDGAKIYIYVERYVGGAWQSCPQNGTEFKLKK